MNIFKILFLNVIGIIFLLFIFSLFTSKISPTFAQSTNYFEGSFPSGWAPCNPSSCPANPFPGGVCANGSSVGTPVGACGWPACSGGSAWQKYQLYSSSTCYANGGLCFWALQLSSNVCSLGDKCTATQPYLNYGYPDCDTGACLVGGVYKTCCSGSSIDGACIQSNNDNISPPEGSCPSGTSTVMCGVNCVATFGCDNCNVGSGVYCTSQPCGTAACQAIVPPATPVPTTPPTGAIQGFHVEMPGFTAYPAGAKATLLDGGNQTTDNWYGTGSQFAPPAWNSISSGNHTVSIPNGNIPGGWAAGYTLCYNVTNCHNTSPTTGSSVTVNVPSGGYADLYWHYFPPPTASISGPTTGQTNQALSYTATLNDSNSILSQGEIWWSTTSTNFFTRVGTSATLTGASGSFSRSWTPTAPGTYYLVVNGYNSRGGKCTGNPFGIDPGWANCGSNDSLTVTITEPPATVTVNAFIDDGAGGGTAGDGIKNGGETNISSFSSSVATINQNSVAGTQNITGSFNASGVYTASVVGGSIYQYQVLPNSPWQITKYSSNKNLTGTPTCNANSSCDYSSGWTRTYTPPSGDSFTFWLGLRNTTAPTSVPTAVPTSPPGTYSISGDVFIDNNGNGVKDGTDTNYVSATNNLALRISSCSAGTLVGERASASTLPGYSFSNLTNGQSYYLNFALPSGYTLTTPFIPSGPNCSGNGRYFVTRTIAGADVTQHWGIRPTSTPIPPTPTSLPTSSFINGTVFIDNGTGGGGLNNGIKDGSEPGYWIQNSNIKLWTGTPLGCPRSGLLGPSGANTDSSGYYSIEMPLTAREYVIELDPLPDGFTQCTTQSSTCRATVCLGTTPTTTTVNFGILNPVNISGRFVDVNAVPLATTNTSVTRSVTINDGVSNKSINYSNCRFLSTVYCNSYANNTIIFPATYTITGSTSTAGYFVLSCDNGIKNCTQPANYTQTASITKSLLTGGSSADVWFMFTQSLPPTPIPTTPPTPIPTPVTYTIFGNVFNDNGAGGGTANNGIRDGGETNYANAPLTLRTGSCTGTAVASVNSSSASPGYTFPGLTNGTTYYIILTRPAGYNITTPVPPDLALCSGSNYFVTRTILGADISRDWGLLSTATPTPTTPVTYSVSGHLFIDGNKDGIKQAGEPYYTCLKAGCAGTIISERGTVSFDQNTGAYQITGITPGDNNVSYTNPPTGYEVTFPENGPPPGFITTLGIGCGASPNTNATGQATGVSCDAGNNVINLNFGITNSFPWIQSKGTDVRFDDGFTDRIPSVTGGSCPGGSSASVPPPAGGSPGVIFSGATTPDYGAGQASALGWQIGDPTYPELYIPPNPGTLSTSYASMMSKINQAGLTPTVLTSPLSAGLGHGLYKIEGDLMINSNYSFGLDQDYIILVNGNLYINGNIDVPNNSTATFIVKGIDPSAGTQRGIIVNTSVTQIEGYYSTDQSFYTGGQNSCALGPDQPLVIEGAVVVNAVTANGGEFVLERDRCAENTCPAVTVITRPDFILNAPALLMKSNALRQEVAP